MTDEPLQFTAIHTLTNRFEADLLMDALHKAQVPAILRSFEETPYDGLFVSQRGWGLIMVARENAARGLEIIGPLIKDLQSRGIYVDPAEIDPLLWERLRQEDPQTICRNAQVRYDSELQAYVVPFLDGVFLCYPEREIIEVANSSPHHRLNFQFYLVMLHYLLEAGGQGLSGTWISEKDIPGGQLFFQGPHKFPLDPLISLFGSRPDLFRTAAERLGGTTVAMGDAAYRLWVYPLVPILFVLWRGDDEFEPALNIRFDGSIKHQLLTLDTIWALVNVVCRSLRSAGKSALEEPAP